jgi:hypothetical protein
LKITVSSIFSKDVWNAFTKARVLRGFTTYRGHNEVTYSTEKTEVFPDNDLRYVSINYFLFKCKNQKPKNLSDMLYFNVFALKTYPLFSLKYIYTQIKYYLDVGWVTQPQV